MPLIITRPRIVRATATASLLVASAFALSACGGDDPQVPSASAATGSLSSTATVNAAVSSIPTVKITDTKGRAVKNVQVKWRVTSGGGKVINDSARTSPGGEASSGGWTLGTVAGTQTLTATADGLPTVTFTAEAAPGAPSRLQLVTGTLQRVPVNTAVPVAPAVKVEDLYGNAVPNVPVVFSVAIGGGTLTGAQQVTNAQGVATIGAWKLGPQSGDQVLRAVAGSLTETSFSAYAEPGPIADIVISTGGGVQEGAARAPSPVTPSVRVVDPFGNAMADVQLTFTPGAGSGNVSSPTVTTNALGIASAVWTLGASPTQTLVAAAPGLPGKSLTFRANAFASGFDIEVRFVGTGGTAQQRDAFARSVVRWRKLLSGDLHATRMITPAGECETWMPAMDEVVNDVVVYARLANIDGPGRILGQASPCYVNSNTRLTAVGMMEFDLADLPALMASGGFDDVVLHEVGHVLGFGTLWNYTRSLLVGAGTNDPYFVGVAARAQFAATNGGANYTGQPIPVENAGGAGTRDGHWRQTIFGRELMQGYQQTGSSPLSATTAASLVDLGYPLVLLDNSDVFTVGVSAFYLSPAQAVNMRDDIADVPIIEVGANGSRRVVRAKGSKR